MGRNLSEIYTELNIRASARRVWEALTDLEHYRDWNPFLVAASGTVTPGSRVRICAKPSGSLARTFFAEITKAEPNRELRWIGRLYLPGVLDGEHIFNIEPRGPAEIHLIHREVFRGLIVPFHRRLRLPDTTRGFKEMNFALKQLVEKRS
jgi:hypothetical protein